MADRRFFSDLALSRRLERAEGLSNASFVRTRASIDPQSGATAIEVGGAFVMYDGIGSPVTQTFCLGLFEPATAAVLDTIEDFYRSRGVSVTSEVSPLATVGLYRQLADRAYRPTELSSVLVRGMSDDDRVDGSDAIATRVMVAGEEDLWARTGAAGWLDAAPDLADFLFGLGAVNARRPDTICFFAEVDQSPIAAGALSLNEGVALLSGASTLPAARGRGAQRALLQARLAHARQSGCDLAMMGALPGSASQRNAERQGFRIAYTRTKWELTL
jgi:GNAT superfamily N-acetyltransferase